MIDSEQREQQRFEYLVLERHRPRAAPIAPARRKAKTRRAKAPPKLAPGIEERVAIRERWSHKQGTPETHEHAARAAQRPGSIARLYASGTISPDQLAAADAIREAYRTITADVSVRTASLETRIDGGRRDAADVPIGRTIAEFAYGEWRDSLTDADPVLAIVIDDVGLTIAARRYRLSDRRMRLLLTDALDRWWEGKGRARRALREASAPL